MENLDTTLGAVFAGMLFLIWILPGVVCRKGKAPEDFPPRKGGWQVPRSIRGPVPTLLPRHQSRTSFRSPPSLVNVMK